MHISKMKKSNYLAKGDVDPAVAVTIESVKLETVGTDADREEKYVLHFRELEKGLVLNWTNSQSVAIAVGSEDTDDWSGERIVLYFDPTVAYKGKVTGGIRVRPAEKKAAAVEEGPNDPIPGWDDVEVA
jgi:hypothetical protein